MEESDEFMPPIVTETFAALPGVLSACGAFGGELHPAIVKGMRMGATSFHAVVGFAVVGFIEHYP